jgi:adenylate cyclase
MQRKLTAILSADVVGYGGLMEADETGTLDRRKANRRKIFDPQVALHGGRQFKLMGDGALLEFSSVIAAVNCALAIQEATERAAADSGEGKPIRYRIGINLGEVIVEGEDIYGEGVNVAARIQTLSPVGGVALSKIVKDQVDGKALCVFEDLGAHSIKNNERPVHVFSVRAAGTDEPRVRDVESPRKLSICVLPFANMSGDVEQEYFSDGISEDIITDLSKVSALAVISRNSAFMYKGKHIDLPKVARELKVSHVLEGSVRKSGNRVRITAQLIDAATNGHVWAERYDRDLSDIFSLQDEISEAIVRALKLKLLPEEKKAIEQRGTANVEAYKLYLMARQVRVTGNLGNVRNLELPIRLCLRAVEIDPSYALAWALVAHSQMSLRVYGAGSGENGLAAAERAIALDPNLADAHAAKARILVYSARYDEARIEHEIALRLDPHSYEVNCAAGASCLALHRFDDAIRYFEKAADIMETDFWAVGMVMGCYAAKGDREGAVAAARRALPRIEKLIAVEPDHGSAMSFGVHALVLLGQVERAREWAERAKLFDPDNVNMRYNLACSLVSINEFEAALDMLVPIYESTQSEALNWSRVDPDLAPLREHPRFKAMDAAAEARLAAKRQANSPSES